MTDDEILDHVAEVTAERNGDWLFRFANRIESATIERCAEVCEERSLIYGDTEIGRARKKTALACASIIRWLKK